MNESLKEITRIVYLSLLCLICLAAYIDEVSLSQTVNDQDKFTKQIKAEQFTDYPENKLIISNYELLEKSKFPSSTILFVTSKGCKPCEVVKRNVLTDPQIIKKLNENFFCVVTTENNLLRFPYLVFIQEGGTITRREQCPTTVTEFLNLILLEERKL